jgi:hypothetical protein
MLNLFGGNQQQSKMQDKDIDAVELYALKQR